MRLSPVRRNVKALIIAILLYGFAGTEVQCAPVNHMSELESMTATSNQSGTLELDRRVIPFDISSAPEQEALPSCRTGELRTRPSIHRQSPSIVEFSMRFSQYRVTWAYSTTSSSRAGMVPIVDAERLVNEVDTERHTLLRTWPDDSPLAQPEMTVNLHNGARTNTFYFRKMSHGPALTKGILGAAIIGLRTYLCEAYISAKMREMPAPWLVGSVDLAIYHDESYSPNQQHHSDAPIGIGFMKLNVPRGPAFARQSLERAGPSS